MKIHDLKTIQPYFDDIDCGRKTFELLLNDKNGNPFDVVGRTFPCWIRPDGEIVYDKEKHKHMCMKPIDSSQSLTEN